MRELWFLAFLGPPSPHPVLGGITPFVGRPPGRLLQMTGCRPARKFGLLALTVAPHPARSAGGCVLPWAEMRLQVY